MKNVRPATAATVPCLVATAALAAPPRCTSVDLGVVGTAVHDSRMHARATIPAQPLEAGAP